MINWSAYKSLTTELAPQGITLVAVSKLKPATDIQELYNAGHRDFGENYVQELAGKEAELPKDIRWHFIGHLQSNKVKYIAPFVHLIHSVDSVSLLTEIMKQAAKNQRVIQVLLQVYIATEESKFGLDMAEAEACIEVLQRDADRGKYVQICGVMGMASNTDSEEKVRTEFKSLKTFFDTLKQKYFINQPEFHHISMGMSGDYKMAIEESASMVRIGSTIFGSRS